MHCYKLAFLGFGNVGQALARLLLRKETELKDGYNISIIVTGIATAGHGSAIASGGLDLLHALELVEAGSTVNVLSTHPPPRNNLDFIQQCGADVLFENTPVDQKTGEPAVTHIRAALANSMHAITANKGPVVHAFHELTSLAAANRRCFLYESTVMDGAPVFSLFRDCLPAARLLSFRGILNSTTNLILTRMEAGETFDQALAYARSVGIAETDPSVDVDGWDAAIKVAALVTVLMGVPLKPQDVQRVGIRKVTSEKMAAASAGGKRWKLVCSARREGTDIVARVKPEMVPSASPMYNIEGTTSIIEFETDVLGLLTLVETDPGPQTTAYGLLADFINAVKESSHGEEAECHKKRSN